MTERLINRRFAVTVASTILLSGLNALAQGSADSGPVLPGGATLRPYDPSGQSPAAAAASAGLRTSTAGVSSSVAPVSTAAPAPNPAPAPAPGAGASAITAAQSDKPPVPSVGAPLPSGALPAPKAAVAPAKKVTASTVAPVPSSPKTVAAAPSPAPAPAKSHRAWWQRIIPLPKSDDTETKPAPVPTTVAPKTAAAIGSAVNRSASPAVQGAGDAQPRPKTATTQSGAANSGNMTKQSNSVAATPSSRPAATPATSATGAANGARPVSAVRTTPGGTAPVAATAKPGAVPVKAKTAAVPPPNDLSTFIRQVESSQKPFKRPPSQMAPASGEANPTSRSQSREMADDDPPDRNSEHPAPRNGASTPAHKSGSPSTAKKTGGKLSEFDLEAEVPIEDDGKTPPEKAAPIKKRRTETAEVQRDSQSKEETAPDPRTLDPMPHYRKSVRLTKAGDYKNALKEVNRALYLNPHLLAARYQGALLFQLEGRTVEAIKRYKELLDLDPQYCNAHINLGICYRKNNQLDDAEDEYRTALEQNFYSLPAHYNLASVLIEKDDLEGALKELKACSKLAPSNAPVHNNLGVIYEKRHYLEEAEEEFLRALTLEPANEQFGRNLEHVRYKLKRKPVKA